MLLNTAEPKENMMKIKTITYKRIFNVGNYESKHLEMTAEIDGPLFFAEDECTTLMQSVERKIREDAAFKIVDEIKTARTELHEVNKEIESGKRLLAEIGKELKPDTEPDNIPFDSEVNEGGDF